MTTEHAPGAADAVADALADSGEIPVYRGMQQVTRTPPARQHVGEIAVPATSTVGNQKPLPTVDLSLGLRGPHNLPPPPEVRVPKWALQEVVRENAQASLFPDECARAATFWEWLKATRVLAASRAQNGYRYLTEQAKIKREDEAFYHALLRWVAWCDACFWLLTAWYAPHHSQPQPRALTLPFAGYLTGRSGEADLLVRELDGTSGQLLLEDVLADWRALALRTGYLVRLDTTKEEGA